MKAKLACVGVIALTALCVAAQQVTSNSAYGFDFSQIKTFYVKIGTRWGNPANEQHAVQAVARELTSKGWIQAPDQSSADALVLIHGATATKHTVQEFYSGGAGGEDYSGLTPIGKQAVSFKVGTGVIDIFDTKTKKLIFRGTAEDELSESGAENQEKIDNGVSKVFKDFPPR